MNFTITLLIYPGTSNYTTISFIEDKSWFNMYMITLFHIGDMIGRTAGGIKALMILEKPLVKLIWARGLFLIPFLLIAHSAHPVVDNDLFKTINMLLFSLTNGFYTTMAQVQAPCNVEPRLKEKVGAFIGIAVTVGVTLGSFASIGMIPLVPDTKS
jgi:hypothetical protein